jgi:hypothetical protein
MEDISVILGRTPNADGQPQRILMSEGYEIEHGEIAGPKRGSRSIWALQLWPTLRPTEEIDGASYRFHSALNRRPTVLRHRVSE